jgi:hypothetical protein
MAQILRQWSGGQDRQTSWRHDERAGTPPVTATNELDRTVTTTRTSASMTG